MRLTSKWIDIYFNILPKIDESIQDDVFTIYKLIKERSAQTIMSFAQMSGMLGLSILNYVNLDLDNDLLDFYYSEYTAMFIVGSSGCGKTVALQKFVNEINEKDIAIVISPKCIQTDYYGLKMFLNLEYKDRNDDYMLKQIDTALKERNKNLILIFDGLNELNMDIVHQKYHYVELLNLAEKIYNNGCNNIKLIITCRARAYTEYKSMTSLQLNNKYFYCKHSSNMMDSQDAKYSISSLSIQNREDLLSKYIDNNEEYYKIIYKNINQLETPLTFAIAATVYNSNLIPYNTDNGFDSIYELFIKTMLSKLNDEDAFLSRKIIYTNFDLIVNSHLSNEEITKFKLMSAMPEIYYNRFEHIINSLIDINILVENKHNHNRIKFKHDKIEESFFKEYIEEFDYKGIEFIDMVFNLCYKNVIYQSGMLSYLINTAINKRLTWLKEIAIKLFDKHVKLFPKILIESLWKTTSLHDILGYLLNESDADNSIKLLNIILWGMDDMLQDYSSTNSNLKKLVENLYILSNSNKLVYNKLAYLHFFNSKIYYFENDYANAQVYVDNAIECANGVSSILGTALRMHKAVILMELGYSKKSIELLENEYMLVNGCNNHKQIFEVGIELGRALNHSGQIEKTLNLYDSLFKIETEIDNPYSLARLYEQKANVLNRIMFDKLDYGFENIENLSEQTLKEIDALFDEAIDLYNKAMNLLLKINALWSYSGVVPEKINTYVSYSYSVRPKGIEECSMLINEVDNIFHGFNTPFKTDFYIAKAYYYEYKGDIKQAYRCVKEALLNAENLGIKNKQAKCHEFISQLIYRFIKKEHITKHKVNWINFILNHLNHAINYYEKYTLIEGNIALLNCKKMYDMIENY